MEIKQTGGGSPSYGLHRGEPSLSLLRSHAKSIDATTHSTASIGGDMYTLARREGERLASRGRFRRCRSRRCSRGRCRRRSPRRPRTRGSRGCRPPGASSRRGPRRRPPRRPRRR
ncbi:hypothetical protein PVAP13_2KG409105 [Panicum virgatum]|uniref:Uncharacterized protein n=1 Tax=Panicum virgatum TaxID=38727 RepID=A0A8T0WAD4_PANVG|nr:hypothetical protein PVAP13_2KG409105 [Panicum virgatum]